MTEKGKLTTVAYWDDHWSGLTLPQRVDPASPATRELDRLLKETLGPGPLRVLEVGTAPSQWLHYFWKEYGYDAVGIDYSATGCRTSRENLRLLRSPGQVVVGDIFQPPFPAESFDLVFSMGVVEHFDSMEPILQACTCLLRPGGFLLTVVPNMRGSLGLLQRIASEEFLETHNPVSLEALRAAHSGLTDLEVRYLSPLNLSVVKWPRSSPGRDRALYGMQRVFWSVVNSMSSPPNSELLSSHLVALGRKAV